MKTFKTNFLTYEQAQELARKYGTPAFIYSSQVIERQAQQALSIPAPYGLTVRYAIKANPHREILKILKEQGVKVDASSGYEAELAMEVGFKPSDILLTSQQLPHNLSALISSGVQFNATSLRQLEEYGKHAPGSEVSVRLNPGIGSGHSSKTNTGGATSSFGIWHEYIDKVDALTREYGLIVVRLHTHIGSGADSTAWQNAAKLSLGLAERFHEVSVINLGGGFKVARMDDEVSTDTVKAGQLMGAELEVFYRRTDRKLCLEIEPGTYIAANAGILLCRVEDIVDTGSKGFTFLKLDTGMNDILRPSLYGAQHPITVLGSSRETDNYVVVGHNCESGDLLTPAPGEAETLSTRKLIEADVGDLVLIGGAGAYCASMAARGYNSYPVTPEIMLEAGKI